jgi:hypothetical protein
MADRANLSYSGNGVQHQDPLSFVGEQLQSWRDAGTYQRLRELQSACGPVSRFDGREVINLASNNYLGLADHPRLVEAAVEATRKYGVGSGAVRTISGTMTLHLELERHIAAFKHVRRLPVGFCRERGCRLGHTRTGRLHRIRRAEPRLHH